MNQRKVLILLLFSLFICGLTINSFAQKSDDINPKNVLMLFALEPGQPFYEDLIESIKNKIRTDYHLPVNFYMDFVELTRFSDEQNLESFFEFFNKRHEGVKFDIFISVGPGLIPVMNKYRVPIIDSLPKLFFEISNPMLKQNTVNKGKKETFVFLDLEIEKNFKCALDLFPDARNIFIMSGNSDLDKAFLNLYKFVLKDYKDKYTFNYLSGLTISELIDKLNNLPGKSLVFASSYQKDTKGVSYYNKEVMKTIFKHARAPIFQLFYAAFEGSIGGLLINSSLVGEKLGEISVRILNGENPDSIGTYHGNFSEYIFDAKQLKKWKISEKSLPEGSIVLNKENSFFEENYLLIIAGFIFLVLETILLIFLINFYGKQKKQSIIIREQEDRYLRLVDFNRLSELSELTASLSHQLKQPLTAILCNSQALLRFINNDKFEKELSIEILGNIVENVKTASEIITSLRGMMKKETLEKKQVNINQIAKNVLILTNSQTTYNNIIVESKFDKKEPYIYADPMLIEQVILNLMENAIEEMKYKTNGQKKIIIMTEMQDSSVNLSVMDNGTGIPDSLEKIIFRPFFSTKSEGLGIGLALCKSIIEEHEGEIKFENNASEGATFSFKLKTVK